MEKNKKIRNLSDLKARRLEIKAQRKALEQGMFFRSGQESEPSNISWLLNGAQNLIGNKLFNAKNKKNADTSNNNVLAFLPKDKWGIITLVTQILSKPKAQGLFNATKKSFIKWQLFNIGVWAVRWGIKKYREKREEKRLREWMHGQEGIEDIKPLR